MAVKLPIWATGRRKTAVARVRLLPGDGTIQVNDKDYSDYFPRGDHQHRVLQPLQLTDTLGRYDVIATVAGGGKTGQAGALRHGIARALEQVDEDLRVPLKKAGYLTRDPRMKERKKYGRKKARKSPQFSKR